jgi:dolichol-phosphate mannosyltransferase
VNQGLGAALRDGLRRAVELAAPDDVIVTMDADNTHPPELIPAMVHAIAAGSDVVIASRYRRGSRVAGLSAVRHVMSFGARVLFTLAFPIRGVRDYTSAFRAYRPQVLERAFAEDGKLVTESGFASMPELLLRLRKANARCRELPMVLLYDHKCSASKMDVAGTAWKTLCMIARLRIAGNGPRWR